MTIRARHIIALVLLSLGVVALSTAVHPVALGAIALAAAVVVAIALSNLMLKPIRRLAEEMERLRRGEFEMSGANRSTEGPPKVPKDELGKLAIQLRLLGKQIESDHTQVLSERGDFGSVYAAVDHLEDGILFATADGRIVFANRSAEAVLGRPSRDALGKHLSDVLAPDHPVRHMMLRAMEDGAAARNAKIEIPMDSAPLELLASVFPVTGNGSAREGAILIVRDLKSVAVSARTFESLIQYSAQLAALGQVTAEVAHDVKNPLQAMVVRVAFLRERLSNPPPDVVRSLDVLEAEINRASTVVDRFMEVVYPSDLARLPVDVNAALRDITALLQAEWQPKGVTLTLQEASDLPRIRGDEQLLGRAWTNLIVNASEAMPSGGIVTVTTEAETASYLKVTISDSGVGIARENVERIFRMYYSTKPEGTGIGLALVRRVIDLHHGSIQIASTVGEGTKVTVRLPTG